MFLWIIAMFLLGTLVLVHEFGHFIVARKLGVSVTHFSIGFGPAIWRHRVGETEYVVAPIPLGGYVKMAGDERSDAPYGPRDFFGKSPGVRARIIAAGPIVNYIVAIVMLWLALVIGYPEISPTVGKIKQGMPAYASGIMTDDLILAIDGVRINSWDQMTEIIHRSSGKALSFKLQRNEGELNVSITPKPQEMKDPFGRKISVGLIGISPRGKLIPYRLSPLRAIPHAFELQWIWSKRILLSLWSVVTGRVSMKESFAGPIGILQMTTEALRLGVGSLIYLISVFSLSLAIFNFFPIPVLDGGHLFFLAVEKIRKRPISAKIQDIATQISLVLLSGLVVFVCINDVSRIRAAKKLKASSAQNVPMSSEWVEKTK
jgi:regulator of sigma E protease